MAISPDNKLLAAGIQIDKSTSSSSLYSYKVLLLDANSLELIWEMPVEYASALAFNNDGDNLAIATFLGSIDIIDIKSKNIVSKISPPQGFPGFVNFIFFWLSRF